MAALSELHRIIGVASAVFFALTCLLFYMTPSGDGISSGRKLVQVAASRCPRELELLSLEFKEYKSKMQFTLEACERKVIQANLTRELSSLRGINNALELQRGALVAERQEHRLLNVKQQHLKQTEGRLLALVRELRTKLATAQVEVKSLRAEKEALTAKVELVSSARFGAAAKGGGRSAGGGSSSKKSGKASVVGAVARKAAARNPQHQGGLRRRVPRAGAESSEKAAAAAAAPLVIDSAVLSHRKDVKRAFQHAWRGYKRYAWGMDTLKPVSGKGDDNFLGMAITLVDSLDTMWVMGLRQEFKEATDWLVANMKFGHQHDVNVFETTIRVVGGFLSAYQLSRDKRLVELAEHVATQLLPAFNSASGIPYGTIDLPTKRCFNPAWTQMSSSTAEVASIQLEFQYLSNVTGDPRYAHAVNKASRALLQMMATAAGQGGANGPAVARGLFPMFVNPDTRAFGGNTITFGARTDSTYEYLLKQWLLLGRGATGHAPTDSLAADLKALYDKSMDGMADLLIKYTTPSHYAYVAELNGQTPVAKMDHLVCFVPGMLALGAWSQGWRPDAPPPPAASEDSSAAAATARRAARDMALAKDLMRTCHLFYSHMPTGLSPEIVRFAPGKDLYADPGAKHNLLRPETVESLMVLFRTTGDPLYRQWGWDIFQAFERHTRVPSGGYSGLKDVTAQAPVKNDHQESFFLGETLKYFYLLFSPQDVLPLDEYVFNTEAHPLPAGITTSLLSSAT